MASIGLGGIERDLGGLELIVSKAPQSDLVGLKEQLRAVQHVPGTASIGLGGIERVVGFGGGSASYRPQSDLVGLKVSIRYRHRPAFLGLNRTWWD